MLRRGKRKCLYILFAILLMLTLTGFIVYFQTGKVLLKVMPMVMRKVTTSSDVYNRTYSKFKIEDTAKYLYRKAKISLSSAEKPINFIPEHWEIDDPDVAPYIEESVIKSYLELPEITYNKTVAILTIVRNAERVLKSYGKTVSRLSYPHKYLSLFLGESGSTDGTIRESSRLIFQLKTMHGFHDAHVSRMNITGGVHGSGGVRHEKSIQLARRAHIALARNTLLKFGLQRGKFDYILWIDGDIEEIPDDLIQQMLFAKSDVVTTPCYLKDQNHRIKYDKNSWQETSVSLKMQSLLPENELVIEGYNRTGRLYLPQMFAFGRVVPLDGVGGCTLMVRAECFRNGLKFPETVYKHHIETEGLAKMARDMNYTVVGLPFVSVYHGHYTAR